MGKDIADAFPAAKQTFDAADTALGEAISTLCFEGPEAALKLTANTQPAIVATSVALLRALDRQPDVAAGHSLGEYAAHVAAGTLDFADAVKLVRKRGSFMQQAVPAGEGAMAAVLGPSGQEVVALCEEISQQGPSSGAAEDAAVVEAVNFNCPGQTVVAGSAKAVSRFVAAMKQRGGRAIELPVSAPFHSRFMKPAEEALAPHLADTQLGPMRFPVVCNVDARALTDGDKARDALVRQVSRPVRWEESIRLMLSEGVKLFVEVGPGKVLSGLLGRIDRNAAKINVETAADIEKARQAIDAAQSAR